MGRGLTLGVGLGKRELDFFGIIIRGHNKPKLITLCFIQAGISGSFRP